VWETGRVESSPVSLLEEVEDGIEGRRKEPNSNVKDGANQHIPSGISAPRLGLLSAPRNIVMQALCVRKRL
jgi:hypothetical protein